MFVARVVGLTLARRKGQGVLLPVCLFGRLLKNFPKFHIQGFRNPKKRVHGGFAQSALDEGDHGERKPGSFRQPVHGHADAFPPLLKKSDGCGADAIPVGIFAHKNKVRRFFA